jgi:tetratricopeptide (TPR) repeat protein
MNNQAPAVRFRIDGNELDNKTATELVETEFPLHGGSVRVCSVQVHRSALPPVDIDAEPGKDIVVVKIESGPALLLHPESAKALLASGELVRSRTQDDRVLVTGMLPWTAETAAERRSGESLLRPLLTWFGVVRLNPLDGAAKETASAIARKIDGQSEGHLYRLQHDKFGEGPEGVGQPTAPAQDRTKPLLVLIHGTFVNAAATFGKLWEEHRKTVKQLFDCYDNRVFAFDHPTLTASPVANALVLARLLPDDAVVHMLTHSRGGLIAEILVRASTKRFDEENLAKFFSDADTNGDAALLRQLREVLFTKHISIERVVRIACPARGTHLASRRLDAYVSVIEWLMRYAGLTVTPFLVSFLREVALQGLKPEVLPGIAAMVPDSALVRWLNSPMERVASSLAVIAGDSGGDSVKTWIKKLVADAYFWTDNDLVVQTRSMFGGAPRAAEAAARFVLLRGGKVSHFSYFSFDESVETIADALLPPQTDRPPKPWRAIGPLSWRGGSSSGVRAPRINSTARPSVIVIPDFFGSHLEADGKRIWLSTRSVTEFARLSVNGNPTNDGVTATELVNEVYGELCNRLGYVYKVVTFPYDWRLPIADEAVRLAKCIADELGKQSDTLQPVKIIAHGMGGLLVRAVHMNHEKTWNALMTSEGARIVMLGTPNAGSWTPIQALSGDETFGNVFASTGPLFGDATIRATLAGMPGFVQLQAGLLDAKSNLDSTTGWDDLEQIQEAELTHSTKWHMPRTTWSIPSPHLLTGAKIFWRGLEEKLPELAGDKDKIALVLGTARSTPCAIFGKNGELFLEQTANGDGRVTLESARLLDLPVWCIPAEHGQLPVEPAGFGGILDLLAEGTTTQLKKYDIPRKGSGKSKTLENAQARARAARHLGQPCRVTPPSDIADLFNVMQDDAVDQAMTARLAVSVYHGDLRFVRQALLVGHYQSLSLTGSEAVVDTLVNGRMSKAARAGIYPERVGSYQIFENDRNANIGRQKQRYIPRPKAAIIVGLGEEGKLDAQHLSFTIRNGILAYAERLAEQPGIAPTFEIAATLVGSGGTGITVGNAALALVQAITDGNARLEEIKWPQVSALKIVEMFLDRAADALRVLKMHAQANPERIEIEPNLSEGNGRLRRPLESSYRGATYDFIRAREGEKSPDGNRAIEYSLDTKRARTEVRAQRAQGSLLRDLVAKASSSAKSDPLIGRTLFNLLVPVEIEPYLAGSSDIVMELDAKMSALPWELLDTEPDAKTEANSAPWAIRSKMIRKLGVQQYRAQIVDASLEDNVLIIGEPMVNARYGSLPGAKREADAISNVARQVLGANSGRVTLLAEKDDAHKIINQLFARNYRMVHIAGHGAPGRAAGVVLSGDNTFLGVNEIMAMRVTPELVFVNCCHLAQLTNIPSYDRVAFAASVAEALINIGVRCVIAAGWAIDDTAAEKFATTFYKALFNGARFIDAVGQARKAAWDADREGNTWAAYQCYGDPDWSWRDTETAPPPEPDEEFAGVSSPTTLSWVLESIATEVVYAAEGNTARHRARLEYLEETFNQWTGRGEVAQAFGKAYADLADRQTAIKWFDRARKASDGGATFVALELYAEQKSLPDASEDELREAIEILTALNERIAKTLRRHALCGNAYKRRSVKTGSGPDLESAIKEFAEAVRFKDEKYNFYPARAVLDCALRKHLLTSKELLPATWRDLEIAEVGSLIDKAAHDDPDFWSVVAQFQLDVFKAILHCRLQHIVQQVERALNDLHTRIRTRRYWIYVHDDVKFLLDPYRAFAEGRDEGEGRAVNDLMELLGDFSEGRDTVRYPMDRGGINQLAR